MAFFHQHGGRGRGRGARGGRNNGFIIGFGRGRGRSPGSGRGRAQGCKERDRPSLPYGIHFDNLIQQEWDAERAKCEELWKRPVGRLVAEGLCINGLWAELSRHSATLVELKSPHRPLPRNHSFSRGDAVRLQTGSSAGGSSEQETLEGIIADVGPSMVRVEVEGHHEDKLVRIFARAKSEKKTWRLDLGFSTVTFTRMQKALSGLVKGCSSVLDFVVTSYDSPAAAIMPLFPSTGSHGAVMEQHRSSSLNQSQLEAITAVCGNPLTLIQGPPGTGKTQTCATVLCHLASVYGKGSVLACAFNNVAIDELSKRVKAVGGDRLTVVRLGEPSRSDPEAQALSLANLEGSASAALRERLEINYKRVAELRRSRDMHSREGSKAHSMFKKAEEDLAKATSRAASVSKEISRMGAPKATEQQDQLKQLKAEKHALATRISTAQAAMKEQRSKKQVAFAASRVADEAVAPLLATLRGLEAQLKAIRTQILASADVICCTCIGAGGKELGDLTFSAVLVDECTQALEPACIIPLTRLRDQRNGSTQPARLVLAGDHKQLPPTVVSASGMDHPLSHSLFERMIDLAEHTAVGSYTNGSKPIAKMLCVQYRMHPDISQFPSEQFYGGRLINGIAASQRSLSCGNMARALSKAGVRLTSTGNGTSSRPPQAWFLNIDSLPPGKADEADADTSKVNHGMAVVVKKLVRALVQEQVVESGGDVGVITAYSKQQRLYLASSGGGGDALPDGVEVKTVDGFQGREKPIIVFDTVRCNSSGRIGFLKDPRRLNVGVTRAQYLLVVVGSAKTLQASPSADWTALMGHFHKSGGMATLPGDHT